MNTYNENLHSSVVNSLQSQQIDQKKLASSLNASMFTLYYAEGATITAADKLSTSMGTLQDKSAVKGQAVNNNNLCTNLLSSATYANTCLKQSVTNTAVCAANMQVATNAILKLAGDMGSIFSIINAADFGSIIYGIAQDAQSCMSETAYAAELGGRIAMEASMLIAEVPGQTVLDKSKSTGTAMGNLLKVASNEYNDLSTTVAANNAALAAESVKEKAAEGNYENIFADNSAAAAAYSLTNMELNLNLQVQLQGQKDQTRGHHIAVSFDLLQTPFPKTDGPAAPYPVQDYYIIAAKDQNKSTFSVSKAEIIIENNPKQRIHLTGFKEGQAANANDVTVKLDGVNVTAEFNYAALEDTDGEPIKLGNNYVIFLAAVYAQDYKKKLNVFDEFLSAPSAPFCITNPLHAATGVKAAGNEVHYSIASGNVTLRVMFLPASGSLPQLLTTASLNTLMQKEESLEEAKQTAQTGDQKETVAFLFNIVLAEQVAAGNYIPVKVEHAATDAVIVIEAGTTTDNFGNVLIEGQRYIPAILTMPLQEDDATVSAALSAIDKTAAFTYQPKHL